MFSVTSITVLAAQDFERKVFQLANEERRNRGLRELIWDDRLAAVARAHSVEMATNDTLAMNSQDITSRLQRVGITRGWTGFVGTHSTPEAVMQAFLNPLLETATHVGIGFDYTDGRTRVTLIFSNL